MIGVRLGPGADGLPLKFMWNTEHVPVGCEGTLKLNSGDVYISSEAAVGNEWGQSSKVTLRHAAGKDSCKYSKVSLKSKKSTYLYEPPPVVILQPVDALPVEGSSYYDYLLKFPIGASMHCSTSEEGEGAADDFTVKKVSNDSWRVSFSDTTFTSLKLHKEICQRMPDETQIHVSHGKDPRRVKKEYVEHHADGDEDECEIKFFSIAKVIDLEQEEEPPGEGSGDDASVRAPTVRSFESVLLSLELPPAVRTPHGGGGSKSGNPINIVASLPTLLKN